VVSAEELQALAAEVAQRHQAMEAQRAQVNGTTETLKLQQEELNRRQEAYLDAREALLAAVENPGA